jgi:putative transposase
MIDRSHALPLARQARELGISRGSIYYLPRPVPPADLAIMRRIDELHLEFPFAGSRMLRDLLRQEGFKIGRQHVGTLMKTMAIEAIYRRPSTSKPALGHKIYPYLLRKLAIVRPNQVWATDISYIPMARGFVYLVAIVALRQAQEVQPQGSGLAGVDHDESRFLCRGSGRRIGVLRQAGDFQYRSGRPIHEHGLHQRAAPRKIAISMDGRGAWRDDVVVEPLWRSVKYEEVYLRAYSGVSEARASIGRYLSFYNGRRPHSSLAARTPDQAYFDNLPVMMAA